MALGSHLITVRRLKKYIDDVIGKKANLPDTSKTIIGNISQINSDLTNKVVGNNVNVQRLVIGSNITLGIYSLTFWLDNNTATSFEILTNGINFKGTNDGGQTWTLYWTLPISS